MAVRVEVGLQLVVIQVRRRASVRVRIRDTGRSSHEQRDGPVKVVELCPCPSTYFNFLLVSEVQDSAIAVETLLKGRCQGCGAFCRTASEEPEKDQSLHQQKAGHSHVARSK